MGTSNFSQKESNHIYAVDTEDTKTNVAYEIESSLNKNKKLQSSFTHAEGNEFFDTGYPISISYPSQLIGDIKVNRDWPSFNCEVEITVNLISSAGYYSGFNLDYVTEVEINGYILTLDEAAEESLDYFNETIEGNISETRFKWVLNWIHSERDKILRKVNKVYADNSEPLEVFARFSNGETMYSKVA